MLETVMAGIGGLIAGLLIYHFRAQRLRFQLELQERIHRESTEKMELRLKDFAREVLEERSKNFREDSLRGIEQLLHPFRERMGDFQRKVEEIHITDTKDRVRLETLIENLCLTGQKMGTETENLIRALKGDVKVQGNWGEMILEKILEASGLRPDEEFVLQGKDLGLKDEEGRHQMPDVIINLPEDKHLIIDSKVSLSAYERYVNEGQEEDLCLFLDSLYAHIKGLSNKAYERLPKLVSPDYVMMFIPVEGAFMLAMQKDKELFIHAWEKNIVLVGPSTLLATLRTVSCLWKQERQTKNALEIARQAGALYDKFVNVAQDLGQMQSQIRKVGDSFDDLRGKMLTGKGSLASRMENLKELGAKTSKSLPLNELA